MNFPTCALGHPVSWHGQVQTVIPAKAGIQSPLFNSLPPFIVFCFLFFSSCPLLLADSQGKILYEQKCSQCHGVEGKGDGVSSDFVIPRPRDFTLGTYKIRTTPSGVLPTDDDLFKTISRGIPGTSMPAFEKSLSKKEIQEVIHYIKNFFPKFQSTKPEPIKIKGDPSSSKEIIEKGKELYNKFRCFECHGTEGRGDGPSSPSLKDEKGDAISAADLTKPWNFRGGEEVKDIFTRLTTGLSGSPMPSFLGIFPDEKEDEGARWALAHYVKSLSRGHPNFKSVITAEYFDGEIPDPLDISVWEKTEEIDIPLAGQILMEPRLFIPSIDLVSVSAIYNHKEIIMRIRWNDRTGYSKVSDGKEVLPPSPSSPTPPDSLSIQLPLEKTFGSNKPYFLGGDQTTPVQLLTWSSDFDKIQKVVSRGLNSLEIASATIKSESAFEHGRRTLLVRLPRGPSGDLGSIFKEGEFTPVAFHAGDGFRGESGVKRSISSWYHILPKQPPSRRKFIWPSLVFVGAVVGELLLLRWGGRGRRKVAKSGEVANLGFKT